MNRLFKFYYKYTSRYQILTQTSEKTYFKSQKELKKIEDEAKTLRTAPNIFRYIKARLGSYRVLKKMTSHKKRRMAVFEADKKIRLKYKDSFISDTQRYNFYRIKSRGYGHKKIGKQPKAPMEIAYTTQANERLKSIVKHNQREALNYIKEQAKHSLSRHLMKQILLKNNPLKNENLVLTKFVYIEKVTLTVLERELEVLKKKLLKKKAQALKPPVDLITKYRTIRSFHEVYQELKEKMPHHIYDLWYEFLENFKINWLNYRHMYKMTESSKVNRVLLIIDNFYNNYTYNKMFLRSKKHGKIVYFLRGFFFKEIVNNMNQVMSFLLKIQVIYKIYLHHKIKGMNASFVVSMLRQMSRRAYPLKSMYFHAMFLIRRNVTLKGYRIEFSGRFFRKERAIYQFYRYGALGRRSVDSLLDYKWKSLVMKYGVSTIRLWLNRHDLGERHDNLRMYKMLWRRHKKLRRKLKLSFKCIKRYSRFTPEKIRRTAKIKRITTRPSEQDLISANSFIINPMHVRKIKRIKRRTKKLSKNNLKAITPNLNAVHKYFTSLKAYMLRIKDNKSGLMLAKVKTPGDENVVYTLESKIKSLFCETVFTVIQANIKNLLYTKKKEPMLNWLFQGALLTVSNEKKGLDKSIQMAVKRSYKYYANFAHRFLFLKRWTSSHFKDKGMLMRLHFFMWRATTTATKNFNQSWFNNKYLLSKKAVNNKRLKMASSCEILTLSGRPARLSPWCNSTYRLLYYHRRFQRYNCYYKDNYENLIFARKDNTNNIKYTYDEVYSQDLFKIYKEISKRFLKRRFKGVVAMEKKVKENALYLVEVPFYKKLIDGILGAEEQDLYFYDFIENKTITRMNLNKYLYKYHKLIDDYVKEIEKYYAITLYKQLTKDLHKIKIRFMRTMLTSKEITLKTNDTKCRIKAVL